MFRNKPKRMTAEEIDCGQFLVINEQKYRIGATGENATHKFLYAQLADGTSNRTLEIKLKLGTEMYVFTK
jgi:hypothetical protein